MEDVGLRPDQQELAVATGAPDALKRLEVLLGRSGILLNVILHRNRSGLKTGGTARIGTVIVADALRVDCLQSCHLLRRKALAAVGAVIQRLGYRLELALEHVPGDGATRLDPRGGVDREFPGAGAFATVIQDAAPDVLPGRNDIPWYPKQVSTAASGRFSRYAVSDRGGYCPSIRP